MIGLSDAAIPVIIPAYEPGAGFVAFVSDLLRRGIECVIVVDDGSGPEYGDSFRSIADFPRVFVIQHAMNLGKGAALKTGLDRAAVQFPESPGAVTADADGQHDPDDVVRVLAALRESPATLVMGTRTFDRRVPFCNRFGNILTRALMRMIVGQTLSDTQTGLRGIPSFLIPHLLRLPSTGYEFELDMLIACKHQGCRILEVAIQTIYVANNGISHFRPIFDSMRVYFVLLRFTALSLLTAALDNVVFAITYSATASIGESQITGRLIAMILNYAGARRIVFHTQQKHAIIAPKYVALVICSGLLSYVLIQFLVFRIGLATMPSKLIAEGLLFLANFAVQRDFVFTRGKPEFAKQATDWDHYYIAVPFTAKLTRRYSACVLVDAVRSHALPPGDRPISIVEIGGANSCFADLILSKIPCRSYDVVDTNQYGLSLLEKRVGLNRLVRLHQKSVFDLRMDEEADLVFSVGLVEHFAPAETRRAVIAHFDVLRPGGVAIVTFPTPTLLYRAVRKILEIAGMWNFPDERPLEPAEVTKTVCEVGKILQQETMWPLLLTQHLIVAKKLEHKDARRPSSFANPL